MPTFLCREFLQPSIALRRAVEWLQSKGLTQGGVSINLRILLWRSTNRETWGELDELRPRASREPRSAMY